MINISLLVGISFLCFFSIDSLRRGYYTIVLCDIIAILIFIANLFYLRITKNCKVAGRIIVLIVLFLFEYLFYSGNSENGLFFWLVSYPLITLSVIGYKEGKYWIFLALLFAILIYIYNFHYLDLKNYSLVFIMKFIGVYLLISLVGSVYETTRRNAENVLKANEKKYRFLYEESLSLNIIFGFDRKIIDVSKSFTELLGYRKEDVIGKDIIKFVVPSQREVVANQISQDLKGENTPELQVDVIKKDGGFRTILFGPKNTIIYENNKPKGILVSAIDITDLKRTQQNLRESKQKLNTILNCATESIFTKDLNYRYTFVNEACCKLFGISSEEIIGKTDADFFAPEDVKHINEVDKKVLQGEIVDEIRTKTVKGKKYIFHIIKFPLRDSNGKIYGLGGIARDITRQKEMEEEFFKMQKLQSVGILAGGIAHDFNNILTAILTNISLALTELNRDDEIYKLLSEAKKATVQAKSLTRQLLTFSKGGAPVKEEASMKDLIIDSVHFALRGTNVSYQLDIADDLWPVEIDKGQINQVLNNLIINAVQAMPNGGIIKIKAENVEINNENKITKLKYGKYVKISVQDQGIGIPKENLKNIFVPYFTTKREGSGLGLATSYSIIKKHDGYITVDSQLGVGTTFTFYLPALNKQFVRKKVEQKKLPTRKGRVLVMDDEKMIRDAVGRILRKIGYEVDFARDGMEAIEIYKKALKDNKTFDFVIMDLTIPGGMGGKEAIKKILEIDPDANVIVASGYSNDPIMANYKDYGFKGVVCKPFEVNELIQVFDKI